MRLPGLYRERELHTDTIHAYNGVIAAGEACREVYSRTDMKGLVLICCLFVARGSVVLGQASRPAEWIGTWTLNVEQSTFGAILFPGASPGLKIISQTVRIDESAGALKISGDTVFSDETGSHSVHEESTLDLNSRESRLGPGSLSFKQIDGLAFDIISHLDTNGPTTFGEVSHFAVSPDGKRLTETKTQTERASAVERPDGTSTNAVIRTSKSILVFDRS